MRLFFNFLFKEFFCVIETPDEESKLELILINFYQIEKRNLAWRTSDPDIWPKNEIEFTDDDTGVSRSGFVKFIGCNYLLYIFIIYLFMYYYRSRF